MAHTFPWSTRAIYVAESTPEAKQLLSELDFPDCKDEDGNW